MRKWVKDPLQSLELAIIMIECIMGVSVCRPILQKQDIHCGENPHEDMEGDSYGRNDDAQQFYLGRH